MPWWRNMWGYGIVALLSSLVLLAVSGFAIRRIALEAAATVRWRRAASRLEAEMAELLQDAQDAQTSSTNASEESR